MFDRYSIRVDERTRAGPARDTAYTDALRTFERKVIPLPQPTERPAATQSK